MSHGEPKFLHSKTDWTLKNCVINTTETIINCSLKAYKLFRTPNEVIFILRRCQEVSLKCGYHNSAKRAIFKQHLFMNAFISTSTIYLRLTTGCHNQGLSVFCSLESRKRPASLYLSVINTMLNVIEDSSTMLSEVRPQLPQKELQIVKKQKRKQTTQLHEQDSASRNVKKVRIENEAQAVQESNLHEVCSETGLNSEKINDAYKIEKVGTKATYDEDTLAAYDCSCPPCFGYSLPVYIATKPLRFEPYCRQESLHIGRYETKSEQEAELSDFSKAVSRPVKQHPYPNAPDVLDSFKSSTSGSKNYELSGYSYYNSTEDRSLKSFTDISNFESLYIELECLDRCYIACKQPLNHVCSSPCSKWCTKRNPCGSSNMTMDKKYLIIHECGNTEYDKFTDNGYCNTLSSCAEYSCTPLFSDKNMQITSSNSVFGSGVSTKHEKYKPNHTDQEFPSKRHKSGDEFGNSVTIKTSCSNHTLNECEDCLAHQSIYWTPLPDCIQHEQFELHSSFKHNG